MEIGQTIDARTALFSKVLGIALVVGTRAHQQLQQVCGSHHLRQNTTLSMFNLRWCYKLTA